MLFKNQAGVRRLAESSLAAQAEDRHGFVYIMYLGWTAVRTALLIILLSTINKVVSV